MRISGFDLSNEQNNAVRQNLQNFVTKPENVSAVEDYSSKPASDEHEQNKKEDVTLEISSEALAYRRTEGMQRMNSTVMAATSFSTNGDEKDSSNLNNGNQVLNQYRFFIQPTRYEGSEGVVKRIFG